MDRVPDLDGIIVIRGSGRRFLRDQSGSLDLPNDPETLTTTTMIPGTPLLLNGEEWLIPPLTLRQMMDLTPEIEIAKHSNGIDPAAIAATTKIILVAIRRNYPKMTGDNLLDLLDMGNLIPALLATMRGPVIGGTPVTSAAPHGSPRPALSVVANGSQQ